MRTLRSTAFLRFVSLALATIGIVAALQACASVAPSEGRAAVASPGTPQGVSSAQAAPMSLNVSNGTSIPVVLAVNGVPVKPYEANGVGLLAVPTDRLPPLPWSVEARTSSGRVLTTMTVTAREAVQSGAVISIPSTQTDLSCGRLTIWAGDSPPSGPMPPSPPGSIGPDCAP